MADRDAFLTDPAVPRRAGRDACSIPDGSPSSPRASIRAGPRGRTRRPTRPVAARSISPSSTATATRSASSSPTTSGSGRGSSTRRPAIHYQNRGSYFSLDPAHPNVLEPGKRTLHTLLPGMLFRAGEARPWIVAGSMGGDAQPQIHAQFVSAVVDGGVDVRTAVAAPRWYVEPADHFEPPVEVRLEPRHAAVRRPGPRGARSPGHARRAVRQRPRPRARDRTGGRRTGRRRRFASRPPRTRAARDCRPSTRASCGVLPGPRHMRYSGGRWQAALTRGRHRRRHPRHPGGLRDLERQPELPLFERARGGSRRRRSRACSPNARRLAATLGRRSRRRSMRRTAGGSGSARRRAARACSTRPATRSRSTPCSSSATGPAPRPSCAERARLPMDGPDPRRGPADRAPPSASTGAHSSPTRSGSPSRSSASRSSTACRRARPGSPRSMPWR